MNTNDPFYTRSEFWMAILSPVIPPLLALFPWASPLLLKSSTILSVVLPTVYAAGRSAKKIVDSYSAK